MRKGFTPPTNVRKLHSTITKIELLGLDASVQEREILDRLRTANTVLSFNGRPIQSIVNGVLSASRRRLAASIGVRRYEVKLDRVLVAAYHPEEKALYISMNYDLPSQSSSTSTGHASVGTLVRAGPLSRQFRSEEVSVRTCEMILELMDCIDLIRVGVATPMGSRCC